MLTQSISNGNARRISKMAGEPQTTEPMAMSAIAARAAIAKAEATP